MLTRIRTTREMARMRVASVALAMVLAPAAALAQNYKPGFNIFSPQQDVQIGQQSAAQVNRQMPTYNDARVARIGQRLARVAPGARYPYTFRVVNSSQLNAFALPGGYIYLNRGVLNSARTDDEIAAVLAHEISHVSLRHGTNQASKAYLAQAGLGLVGSLLGGGGGSNLGQIMGALGGFGLNTLFLKFSRDAETQADLMGLQMMRRAGFNPQAMVTVMQKIHRQSGGRGIEMLSSHPNPNQRINRIQQALNGR